MLSSQGNDTYAVFDRQGDHAYRGSFAVVADPARGIDGISETDGLDVNSGNLGPGFEHGAMVAQDGRNVMPMENQNYSRQRQRRLRQVRGQLIQPDLDCVRPETATTMTELVKPASFRELVDAGALMQAVLVGGLRTQTIKNKESPGAEGKCDDQFGQ